MKYYEAQALVAVDAGATLHLTDAQAAARKYGTAGVEGKPGFFKASQALYFKKGEVFGADQAPRAGSAVELKADAREFEARIKKERAAAAEAKQAQLAERKRREEAAAAAQRRKDEERRRATESHQRELATAAKGR